MDELASFLKLEMGWAPPVTEMEKIYSRYFDNKIDAVNYDHLLNDFRKGVLSKEKSQFWNSAAIKRNLTYGEILELLFVQMKRRTRYPADEDPTTRILLLLGLQSYSMLSRAELRMACQSRLAVTLHDAEVEEVFDALDPRRDGLVSAQQLVSAAVKKGERIITVNVRQRPPSQQRQRRLDNGSLSAAATINLQIQDAHQSAIKTMPETIELPEAKSPKSLKASKPTKEPTASKEPGSLTPPDPASLTPLSMTEMESAVTARIIERSNGKPNMIKATLKLFGRTGKSSQQAGRTISLETLQLILWKRLKLNLSEEDVKKFYEKYSTGSPDGQLRVITFIEGLLKVRSKPTMSKDHYKKVMAELQKKRRLQEFLVALRGKVEALPNLQDRLSVDSILDGHAIATTESQAKRWLQTRLSLDFEAFSLDVRQEVLREYHQLSTGSGGLVNLHRMLMDALALMPTKSFSRPETIEDGVKESASNELMARGLRLQTSNYKRVEMTPERVKKALYDKCAERLRNEHSFSGLSKMFRDPDCEARVISKKGLQTVFRHFDLSLTPQEFDTFFAGYDRGDGKIDVPTLLYALMPTVDLDNNPFMPKDPTMLRFELEIAQAAEKATRKRREVSNFIGSSFMRTKADELQKTQSQSAPTQQQEPGATSGGSGVAWSIDSTLPVDSGGVDVSGSMGSASPRAQTAPSQPFSRSGEATAALTGTIQHAPSRPISLPSSAAQATPRRPNTTPANASRPNVPSRASAGTAADGVNGDGAEVKPASGGDQMWSEEFDRAHRQPQERQQPLLTITHLISSTEDKSTKSTPAKATVNGNQQNEFALTGKSNNPEHPFASSAKRPFSAPIVQEASSGANTGTGTGTSKLTTGSLSPRTVDTARFSQTGSTSFDHTATAGGGGGFGGGTTTTRLMTAPAPSASQKFVSTGRRYRVLVDPISDNLRARYRMSHNNIATTQEEYGLFVKTLSKAIVSRQELYHKQDLIRRAVQQHQPPAQSTQQQN